MVKKDTKKKKTKIEITEKELEELKKKAGQCDEAHNKFLQVHAEYDNIRKRMEKEKINLLKFANEGIISRLFPIVDNFDMAFEAMEKAEDKAALMDGIALVQKEFHRILEENGVKKIETEGKQFDPNVHEAVLAVPTTEHTDEAILEEVRAGYTLNDRLLRPAQVKVAKNDGEPEGENNSTNNE